MTRPDLLDFDVAYPARLKRWLIFLRVLFLIPHIVIFYFLGLALWVVTFIAWWAILFTGRYPQGMWSFAMSVMRWSARIQVYAFNLRDEYPPFGDGPYAMKFEQSYPSRQSRLQLFLRPFTVLPHYICLWFVAFAASIVYVVAWFAVLFLGRMPRGMFDFLVGTQRWAFRVSLYLVLLTDAYPPFSLDGGAPVVETPAPAFAANA